MARCLIHKWSLCLIVAGDRIWPGVQDIVHSELQHSVRHQAGVQHQVCGGLWQHSQSCQDVQKSVQVGPGYSCEQVDEKLNMIDPRRLSRSSRAGLSRISSTPLCTRRNAPPRPSSKSSCCILCYLFQHSGLVMTGLDKWVKLRKVCLCFQIVTWRCIPPHFPVGPGFALSTSYEGRIIVIHTHTEWFVTKPTFLGDFLCETVTDLYRVGDRPAVFPQTKILMS